MMNIVAYPMPLCGASAGVIAVGLHRPLSCRFWRRLCRYGGVVPHRDQLLGERMEAVLDLAQRIGHVRGVWRRHAKVLTTEVLYVERDGGELIDRVVKRGAGTRKRRPFGHRAGFSSIVNPGVSRSQTEHAGAVRYTVRAGSHTAGNVSRVFRAYSWNR
jgi:hypothetical protein